MGLQVNSNFSKDLDRGHKAEDLVKKVFESCGYTVEKNESEELNRLKEWDLKIYKDGKHTTVECKADPKSRETGNIVFEIGHGTEHKPTALLESTSKYWCHVFYIEDTTYITVIKTAGLRKLLLTEQFYRENDLDIRFIKHDDGDRSDLLVVKAEDFLKVFNGKVVKFKEW